jgi:hypothetical protein
MDDGGRQVVEGRQEAEAAETTIQHEKGAGSDASPYLITSISVAHSRAWVVVLTPYQPKGKATRPGSPPGSEASGMYRCGVL